MAAVRPATADELVVVGAIVLTVPIVLRVRIAPAVRLALRVRRAALGVLARPCGLSP